MKLQKGILVFSRNNSIEVFVEDSDEENLLYKGDLKLELEEDDDISNIFLSYSTEEVMISTIKSNLYSWKCEHIDLDTNHFDFAFAKVESSCSNSHKGSLSISTGRKFCMLAGERNVTLWNVDKN